METTTKKSMVELCVFCGCETPYSINAPVYLRENYVEGAGQLCKKCFDNVYGSETAKKD